MELKHNSVTIENVTKFADELHAALVEVTNGGRKLGDIPMEPMVALIQFARDAKKVATPAGDARDAEPTDTELLDWIEENTVYVAGVWGCKHQMPEIELDFKTASLRQAIAAIRDKRDDK